MEGPPPRRPLSKIVWLVLAAIFFLPLILVLNALRHARQTIDRYEVETKARFEEYLRQSLIRPPILDDPLPGNAWDDYQAVFGDIRKSSTVRSLSDQRTWQVPSFDLDSNLILLKPYLERLSHALHRHSVYPAHLWTSPGDELYRVSPMLEHLIRKLIEAHRDTEALDILLIQTGFNMDMARHAQVTRAAASFHGFIRSAGMAAGMFESHSLKAPGLARFAGDLDAIERSRPTMLEAWEVTDALGPYQCALYLNSPDAIPDLNPSWRDLGSSTLARARACEELPDFFRHYLKVGKQPLAQRARLGPLLNGSDTFTRTAYCTVVAGAGNSYPIEAEFLREWALLRLMTALAWYESEKGSHPAKLADLVPRYLASVPDPLPDGSPLRYAAGRLEWTVGGSGRSFTVRRR
jgi:hypothetical protein